MICFVKSNVNFENFDHYMALRYLTIAGGREMLEKAKIGRLMIKWNGDRQDLINFSSMFSLFDHENAGCGMAEFG